MSSEMDLARVSLLFHIHTYSLSRALSEVLGEGQVVLINNYAKAFLDMTRIAGFKLESMDAYISSLKDMRFLKGCKLNWPSEQEAEFVVEKCYLASLIHKPLNMAGYTGDLCPLAVIAMVVLAVERGWKPGENLFDYVRFSEKLSYFTEDGTKNKIPDL